ncbi:MAG: arginine N-succinyltransferase [Sneathiella sp.]|nr:arginine N-succinyltransferase [Sneathiella sp.]
MIVIREAKLSDLDQLMEISSATGSGMSSMPTNLQSWQAKLEKSEESFAKEASEPKGEIYFMAMEDADNGKIVGTTAIYAGVGLSQPFYSYKVSKLVSFSKELDKKNQMEVLHLVNDFTGTTEIGSLYLDPDYRKDGNGRFLSRCRFLMFADFPDRFGETIIAEMRGWQDGEGQSPFWEHLGRKFFGLGFENADFMSSVKGNQFITDLMPRHPVYSDLLPEAARNAIGKPHNASAPALRLLEKEGFRYSGYADIFDGGPTVQCQVRNIQTCQDRAQGTVGEIVPDERLAKQERYIISNQNRDDYRFICAPLIIEEDGSLTLSEVAATALRIGSGQTLSYVL